MLHAGPGAGSTALTCAAGDCRELEPPAFLSLRHWAGSCGSSTGFHQPRRQRKPRRKDIPRQDRSAPSVRAPSGYTWAAPRAACHGAQLSPAGAGRSPRAAATRHDCRRCNWLWLAGCLSAQPLAGSRRRSAGGRWLVDGRQAACGAPGSCPARCPCAPPAPAPPAGRTPCCTACSRALQYVGSMPPHPWLKPAERPGPA
jgi:hypothetical protein